MAKGYKVLELSGSHLFAAVDLYNLLINYNGKKDFTIGPFSKGGSSLVINVEFKKKDLIRVSGEFLTVPYIINLTETNAIMLTEHNVNQIGLFYDVINIFKVEGIEVQIKVIELSDSIVEECKKNYVASTDELIIASGKCLKNVDKVGDFEDGYYSFTSEDLIMNFFLEDTSDKHAAEIINCIKDLYGGSNYRLCFASDVHEYIVLVYSDIGVYHYQSLNFNRHEKLSRMLYKNIVKVFNKAIDAPVSMNFKDKV